MAGSTEAELVSRIKEKLPDLMISIKDIKVPTVDFVVTYYTRVLQDLRINVNNLAQPNTAHFQKLNIQDYTESIGLSNLFTTLQNIFQQIYISDITMFDLISPSPRRTLRNMVALDNFHSFAHMKHSEINVKVDKLFERKEAQTELEKQKELLIHELNQQACEHGKRKDAIEQLEMKIKQQKATVLELQQQKSDVLKRVEKVRTEKYDEDYNLELVQKTCVTLDREICELQKKVVQSPAQLVLQVQDWKDRLEAIRKQLAHKETTLRTKKEQLSTYQEILQKPQVCHAHLNELLPLYSQIQERETSRRKMLEKKVMVEDRRGVKLVEKEKHVRLLQTERERHCQLVSDWERRSGILEQQLADVKLEVEEGEKKQKEENRNLSSLEGEVVELRILESKEFGQLLEKVEAYHQWFEDLKEQTKEFNENAEQYLKKDIKKLEDLSKK